MAQQHVLVVDDDDDIRLLMRMALEHAGHRVTEAENGAVAIHVLEEHGRGRIDMIVADVSMPLVTGLELANRVRARLIGERLPILIVSAQSSRAAVADAFAAGADAFLAKPFTLAELAGRVDLLLGRDLAADDAGGASTGP